MEFDTFFNFINSLLFAKRKYPTILSYIKYLKKQNTIEEKTNEINKFKTFLIQNPNILESKLDNPFFKTGKADIVLVMTHFLTNTEEKTLQFWKDLIHLETIVFPDGKPNKLDEQNTTDLMNSLTSNPILSPLIEQVKNMELQGIGGIEDFISSEGFQTMASTIKNNLVNGTYKMADLKNIVSTVINTMEPGENKSILNDITNKLESAERNAPIDINQILLLLKNLKLEF